MVKMFEFNFNEGIKFRESYTKKSDVLFTTFFNGVQRR